MTDFDFCNPTKLIFGRDTMGRIGEEIKALGFEKVLLLAGGGSIKQNGVYEAVTASLKQADIAWKETWGIQPNPVLSKVREMIKEAKAFQADALLAVGGGSVIDSAKAVAAGVLTDDVWALFEAGDPVTEAMPVFTILTISATGSEMDPYAVLSNEETQSKWPIGGPALFPKVSIVDPEVQFTLPWHQTVNGAVDALSHIMEFYFIQEALETTLAVNEALSRTIIEMTDRLEKDPKDYDARSSLAWAATLALNGTSGAGQGFGDWAVHTLEHGVSALYPEVAHGAGLGVLFPAWITYCAPENPPRFERWAKEIWNEPSVEAGIKAFQRKIRSWGNAVTLKELGVDLSRLDEIAANAHAKGDVGCVKDLSKEDLLEILKLAAE